MWVAVDGQVAGLIAVADPIQGDDTRFGVLLDPMLASLAMALSSVSVIANALRLRRLTL
jgi:cation transport ATPase